ncbi:MAG TPA: Asp-tRNA(Asn)/Glu-tRNA(Gln) amidotransferase subunit GatB, partial [Acidimicrobiaceae bacterium]|nr:Asp-tRNA(Asn)/Glu-tRNA(Gln) amidotransferase subunit GatB [Acidimicrobiaceae bacterium]
PAAKRRRLRDAGVDAADAATLTQRLLADLVLAVGDSDAGAGAPAERAATLAVNNIAAGDDGEPPARVGEPGFVAGFARLVALESAGELTATQAKQVLAEMLDGGDSPEEIAAARGFEALADDALTALVDDAIAADADAWAKFCAGEDKVAGVFVGAVMKATRGQADGGAVTAQLEARRAAG